MTPLIQSIRRQKSLWIDPCRAKSLSDLIILVRKTNKNTLPTKSLWIDPCRAKCAFKTTFSLAKRVLFWPLLRHCSWQATFWERSWDPQKTVFFWFRTFSYCLLYRKGPKTKISRKWPPRRDLHLVQKSVPETTKMDKKWCLGRDFVGFRYVHKTSRFIVLLGLLGSRKWQKKVEIDVQKLVSKYTENR